jgi:hypothetical protein
LKSRESKGAGSARLAFGPAAISTDYRKAAGDSPIPL